MVIEPTLHGGSPERVVLRDGRAVQVRRLDPSDAGALAAAVAAADRWDLRRRFLGTPPPTRMLLAQLAHADGVRDLALGAFDAAGQLLAVAQFDRFGDEAVADIAVEVAKDWQDAGLGTLLLEQL